MKKIDEHELKIIFQGIKSGNKDSIELLYKNYHDTIYGIAFSILKNRENSEDVTQNVFAKLLKMDVNLFPSKCEASWLYTVTKNEVYQFLRKQKTNIDIDDLYTLESESNEIDDIVDMSSYYKLLEDLSPIDKEIISLRILSDFTFEKISQMLNMPIGTVEWRYYKALHCIKLSIANLAAFIFIFYTLDTVSKFAISTKYSSMDSTQKPSKENEPSSYTDISVDDFKTNTISELDTIGSASSEKTFYKVETITTVGMIVSSVVFISLAVFFALKKKILIKK